MFSGIVSDIGEVRAATRTKEGAHRFEIATRYAAASMALGSSICVHGICLTVVAKGAVKGAVPKSAPRRGAGKTKTKARARAWFRVDVSPETLARSNARVWRVGTRLHLEQALRLSDRLDGHFVAGHVDGLARLVDRKEMGDCLALRFETPRACAPYLARKGSVALDGTSLTINARTRTRMEVMLIPHSLHATRWQACEVGQLVNLEVDLLARYSVDARRHADAHKRS